MISEWNGRNGGRSDFFSHYGWNGSNSPLQVSVQKILFDIITGIKLKEGMVEAGLRVLSRLDLSDAQRKKAASLALRRFRSIPEDAKEKFELSYLSMLFLTDPNGATSEFLRWVSIAPLTLRGARSEKALSYLFGRDNSGATGALQEATVTSLEVLVRTSYEYIRPEDDRVHEGTYTLNARDKAESARNALLTVLLNRSGVEAYQAMQVLAVEPAIRSRGIRFKELARGKAERDAELPEWGPSEVLAFERQYVAPAKTGEALIRVVMGVLSDIQSSFLNADATSRALIQNATDEVQVQEWLAEQINFRSKGRFHAHREAQIALGDKPDIIVSSTVAQVEVAVEIKHGGKDWTVIDLEKALRKQLVEGYLKPVTRRHGVLVVSRHTMRTWRDPQTKAVISFHDVIGRLQTLSTSIIRNELGPVEVYTFGIDCLA